MKIATREYEGYEMLFQFDGWFNATVAAQKWNKRPVDWLSLEGTKEYIEIIGEILNVDTRTLLKTKRGKYGGGTWLHPKLAVAFARWLNPRFGVWCDEQITNLISGDHDRVRLRHASAAGAKAMAEMLQEVRSDVGKDTEFYVYANEHKMINWALQGAFKGINRDLLPREELDILDKLQIADIRFLAKGLSYEERKTKLQEISEKLQQKALDTSKRLLLN